MVKIQLMKCPFRFWTFSGSALFWLLASYPVTAQTEPIVADTTLPNNSFVTRSGNIITITEGTQRGRNLFHSFKEFSLPSGQAFFDINNAVDIQNIISRVTGGSPSEINGLIGANGTANLFLINPRGIVFGPNASLQIGGSFVASTADSVKFEGGTEFSATNPQAPPLLTISVPLGLQFGSNPVGLQFGSNPGGIVRSTANLQVPSGKTLALVGGNVTLEGGNLTGGRIELGSVGTGLVNLSENPQGYAYSDVQNFQDIQLSNRASVGTSSEGGGIQVRGRNINLTGGALIYSQTLGAGTGGTLTVNAAESVNLSGRNTRLFTFTSGTGTAGNLTIETRNLTVDSGALIYSQTSGAGTGGTLRVDAAESVNLSGVNTRLFTETPGTGSAGTGSAGNLTITTKNLTVDSGASIATVTNGPGSAGDLLVKATDVELSGTTANRNPGGLSAQVQKNATGKGGNLTIETGRLRITDGAAVDASTFGAGQAGNILVKATDAVELVGEGPNFPSGIFAQVGQDAIPNAGNAGTVKIETGRLTVQGGAQISTAARKRGNGGELKINATDSITLSGASPRAKADPLARNRSGIFVSAEPGATGDVGNLNITSSGLVTVEDGAKISAENAGSGQGGSLTLNVRQLTIQNGGLVRANSFAEGAGGILTVNAAESVNVIGKGTFDVSTLSAASTASGPAGNLNIETRSLNVQDGATVSVSGTGSGPAGNLTVTANNLRLNGGKITATTNAKEEGNITLRNLNLLLMENKSEISAQASEYANGGNINIDARNGSVVAVTGENQNNDIIASAIEGRGGKINITASGIFGIEERERTELTNDINASSQFGLAGTVNINRSDVEPNLTLPELSAVLVDPSRLVDTGGCAAFANSEGSSFTRTGRGGLPPNPYEPLSPDVVWSDIRLPNITAQRSQITTPPPSDSHVGTIVPATGWVFNGKGQVTLISNASRTPSLGSTPAKCPK